VRQQLLPELAVEIVSPEHIERDTLTKGVDAVCDTE
jgi:hypothetical protein